MSNGGVVLEDLKQPVCKKEDKFDPKIVTKQNNVLYKYSLNSLLYRFLNFSLKYGSKAFGKGPVTNVSFKIKYLYM